MCLCWKIWPQLCAKCTQPDSIKCIMCLCAFGYWYCRMLRWGLICLLLPISHTAHPDLHLLISPHLLHLHKEELTHIIHLLCSATHVYLLNCNVGKIMGNKIYKIYIDNRWYVILGDHLLTTLLSDDAMTARLHFKHAEVHCRSWGLPFFFVSVC